jgi:hypothetical protein
MRQNGEDYAISQLARLNGPFPLGDRLHRAVALHGEPDFTSYLLTAIPEIQVNHLVHFAMGVFWKASVHTWRKKGKKPWLDLENYRESMRLFLRGEADFPCNMALSLTILPVPTATTITAFHIPYKTIGPDETCHFFVMGLNYTLWMGPDIPLQITATSLHLPPHVLLEVDNSADITRKFREALARHRGKK